MNGTGPRQTRAMGYWLNVLKRRAAAACMIAPAMGRDHLDDLRSGFPPAACRWRPQEHGTSPFSPRLIMRADARVPRGTGSAQMAGQECVQRRRISLPDVARR